MIRVVVHGAAGRMGMTACRAVDGAEDLELVGAVDPGAAGRPLAELVPGCRAGAVVRSSLQQVSPDATDVVVDFTRADVAVEALSWCATNGVHGVSGTTGIAPDALDRLREPFSRPGGPRCVVVANFAISAVLLMAFAEMAALHLDGVEIVELHHDAKRDAPSGTAIETARRIAAARARAGRAEILEPTVEEVLPGARGAIAPGGVHVHAVRLPGLVAHQEVLFGAAGQTLLIRQDSYDRSSFVPGILAAVRGVAGLPGLTFGLEAILGI